MKIFPLSILGLVCLFSSCAPIPQGGEVPGLPRKCYVKYIKWSGSGTANVKHSEGSSGSPEGSVGIKIEVTPEYQIVDCDPKKKAAAEKITAMSANLKNASERAKSSPEAVKQLLSEAVPVYVSSLSTLGVNDPRARRDVLDLTQAISGPSSPLVAALTQKNRNAFAAEEEGGGAKLRIQSENQRLSLSDIEKKAKEISRKAKTLAK